MQHVDATAGRRFQQTADGLTENAGHETAGHENTGHEFATQNKYGMTIDYITL